MFFLKFEVFQIGEMLTCLNRSILNILFCCILYGNYLQAESADSWVVKFTPNDVRNLRMAQYITIYFNFTAPGLLLPTDNNGVVEINIKDPLIVSCVQCSFNVSSLQHEGEVYNGSFVIKGEFLGRTEVKLTLHTTESRKYDSSSLSVSVIKEERLIDHIFLGSVILLVSIMFINFGCALEWSSLKDGIKRPSGPVVGLISHFLFMPCISFILGRLLFPDSVSMRLGLFYTGISPGGEASNIWVYLLEGNINLSIAITTLVIIASFGMIPLWLFTVGHLIFEKGKVEVPYTRIIPMVFTLVVPLTIGYYIQRRHHRLCHYMVRILKPFAACLIIFIIIFASATNLYLFKLFTWRIVLAGMGLPWMGYICGAIFAKLCCMSKPNTIAIAIETGIQNTGIAIFMLKLSLGQPDADLTTVVPVAVASMSPIPPLIYILIRKLIVWYRKKVAERSEQEKIVNEPAQTSSYS